MNVKEFNRLKKILIEANTPTNEEIFARALKVAFKSIEEDASFKTVYDGITIKEAYEIIGW